MAIKEEFKRHITGTKTPDKGRLAWKVIFILVVWIITLIVSGYFGYYIKGHMNGDFIHSIIKISYIDYLKLFNIHTNVILYITKQESILSYYGIVLPYYSIDDIKSYDDKFICN